MSSSRGSRNGSRRASQRQAEAAAAAAANDQPGDAGRDEGWLARTRRKPLFGVPDAIASIPAPVVAGLAVGVTEYARRQHNKQLERENAELVQLQAEADALADETGSPRVKVELKNASSKWTRRTLLALEVLFGTIAVAGLVVGGMKLDNKCHFVSKAGSGGTESDESAAATSEQ